jgi:hypothetical protein
MPYIKKEQRQKVDSQIDELVKAINSVSTDHLELAGVLNYCITRLGLEVIPIRKYWVIALKSGVFHNVADEFYRRYVSDYEDRKALENGDVYPINPGY